MPIQRALMSMARPSKLVVMDTAGGSRDEQTTYAEGSTFMICSCPPAARSIKRVIDLAAEIKELMG